MFRVCIIDVEVVPTGGPPKTTKSGLLIADVENRAIIEIAATDFKGQLVARQRINPEVKWEDIPSFHGYASRCWGVNKKQVEATAKTLPTFREAMPKFLQAIHKELGGKVVFVGHNIASWDCKIIKRQLKQNNLKFPFEVIAFDTRSVVGSLEREAKDRKWSMNAVFERLEMKRTPNAHTAFVDCLDLSRLIKVYCTKEGLADETAFVKRITSGEVRGLNTTVFKNLLQRFESKLGEFEVVSANDPELLKFFDEMKELKI